MFTPFWVAFFFATCSHFIHIYTHLRVNFSCYIFTQICIYLKSNSMLHIHWKGNNFYYSSTFWKTISCHMLLFWEAFSCHFQHICILAKYLATYPICIRFICLLLPTLWPTFPHHLSAKNIKVQPSSNVGLKGKPYQYALISMLSCIQKTKLGSPCLRTYLGTYPSFYKLSLNSTMAATYAQVSSINKIRIIMFKCNWGLSPSTWWAPL